MQQEISPPRSVGLDEKSMPLLHDASLRLMECWTRAGVTRGDEEGLVDEFVDAHLRPLLASYVAHQESICRQLFLDTARAHTELCSIHRRIGCAPTVPGADGAPPECAAASSALRALPPPPALHFDVERCKVSGSDLPLGALKEALDSQLDAARRVAAWQVHLLQLVVKQRELLQQPPAQQREIRASYLRQIAAEGVATLSPSSPSPPRKSQRGESFGGALPSECLGRPTVFQCFAADEVEAEGLEQDLSNTRLQQLCEETAALIAEANERIEARIGEDNDAVAALWEQLGTPQGAREDFKRRVDALRAEDAAAAAVPASQQDGCLATPATEHGAAPSSSSSPPRRGSVTHSYREYPTCVLALLRVACPAATASAVAHMRRKLEDDVFIAAAEGLQECSRKVNEAAAAYRRLARETAAACPADYSLWLSNTEHASLQERLEAVARARAAAEAELCDVQSRVEMITRATDLVRRRADILERQAKIAAEGPGRLQSRDRHAARRRMEEERVRREVHDHLPKLERALRELHCQWAAAHSASPLLVDGKPLTAHWPSIASDSEQENPQSGPPRKAPSAAATTPPPSPACNAAATTTRTPHRVASRREISSGSSAVRGAGAGPALAARSRSRTNVVGGECRTPGPAATARSGRPPPPPGCGARAAGPGESRCASAAAAASRRALSRTPSPVPRPRNLGTPLSARK